MPQVTIGAKSLKVDLSRSEAFWGMHRSLDIPAENISGAQALGQGWWKTLGLRIPGTALPGVIIAGTYIKKGDRAYVSWTRNKEVLQINLKNHRYNRILLGVDDAKALAEAINMAITGC
jgi:hypothetical protein